MINPRTIITVGFIASSNVYAEAIKVESLCEGGTSRINVYANQLKHSDPVLANWKPTQNFCDTLRQVITESYQDGIKYAQSNQDINTELAKQPPIKPYKVIKNVPVEDIEKMEYYRGVYISGDGKTKNQNS